MNFTRPRVILHETKANIEGNTLFGVNWNAYDNSEIHVYFGDHVSEMIKIGGFRVPPAYISEPFSPREIIKLVDHWKKRHILNVIYPNDHASSVFENKLNAEENCQRDDLFWGWSRLWKQKWFNYKNFKETI